MKLYLICITDNPDNPKFICDFSEEQLTTAKEILDMLNVEYAIYIKM